MYVVDLNDRMYLTLLKPGWVSYLMSAGMKVGVVMGCRESRHDASTLD